jgi:hypothetical protein
VRDSHVYQLINVHNGKPSDLKYRSRKQLAGWLGFNRRWLRRDYRIMRAVIVDWEDVTDQFADEIAK